MTDDNHMEIYADQTLELLQSLIPSVGDEITLSGRVLICTEVYWSTDDGRLTATYVPKDSLL